LTLAVCKRHYAIRAKVVREHVGHDHSAGVGLALPLHCAHYTGNGILVEGGKGLVEKEKWASGEKGTAKGEAIALAFAEIQTAVGKDGIHSATLFDGFGEVDGFESGPDFAVLHAVTPVAEEEIFFYGSNEKIRPLLDKTGGEDGCGVVSFSSHGEAPGPRGTEAAQALEQG